MTDEFTASPKPNAPWNDHEIRATALEEANKFSAPTAEGYAPMDTAEIVRRAIAFERFLRGESNA